LKISGNVYIGKKIVMNKIALFFCIATISLIYNFSAFSQGSQFPNTWLSPNIDRKTYEAICIDEIDTSDIKVETDYSDSAETKDSNDPDKIRNQIALELRKRFKQFMGLTLDVKDNKNDIAGSKALIVNVKLSGMVGDDGQFNSAADFSFKSELLDAQSGDKVFTLSNDYKLPVTKKSASGSKGDDLDSWYRAIDLWVADLASYLKRQINISN
jgi:hypothetical protein